jgi:hypothetical protein
MPYKDLDEVIPAADMTLWEVMQPCESIVVEP